MNNGKYHTTQYKRLQEERISRQYGAVKKHNKICECCDTSFVWEGRENTVGFRKARFCSRPCANSTGGKAKALKHHPDSVAHYRVVMLRHHDHKCLVCKFDKIVSAHHIDENHDNNDPKNLVPLCPNCHTMFHSRYRDEIEPHIHAYAKNKWDS